MTEVAGDYVSVSQRAKELGLAMPDGLAVLPQNFETAATPADFMFAGTTQTVRTLFCINDLPLSILRPDGSSRYISYKSDEWMSPILFVAGALMSENPAAVSLALSVVANYLTDYFKGLGRLPNVKLTVVVEHSRGRTCKRLDYEGDVEGIRELADTIKRLADE